MRINATATISTWSDVTVIPANLQMMGVTVFCGNRTVCAPNTPIATLSNMMAMAMLEMRPEK